MTRKTRVFICSYIPLAVAFLCFAGVISVSAQSSSGGARSLNRSSNRGQRARRGAPRSPVIVRARAGETLAALSSRFNVSVEDLAHANNLKADARLAPGQQLIVPLGSAAEKASAVVAAPPSSILQETDANRLRLTDGTAIEFDDVWEDARGVWYRKGGMVNLITRDCVTSIERKTAEAAAEKSAASQTKAKIVEVSETEKREREPVWIYLVGGARVEADEVSETETGAWYKRGGLSIFLERSRIERIERERPVASEDAPSSGAWIARGWTTGNPKLDEMIKAGGQRYGVDPYLIFCVMEQESRFNPRALSPKGARGLMQLMPGTAARFGVRNSFDPQQNIMGGTRYLKQLLEQFNGRVDLVLASYNAGEGAVMKYGGNVPPYRETRDYVRRIGARYGQPNSLIQSTAMTSATRQK
ncbi:MAG: transglycosylase SLT domain-containing protein [Pyrinomonadaceae bacterium]|nr:transglycosylase SLT domain-containing protein [Pyrinomonadaceae bacterium]